MFLSILLLPLVIVDSNPPSLRVSDDVNDYWSYTREFACRVESVEIGSIFSRYDMELYSYYADIQLNGFIGFEDSSNFELYIKDFAINVYSFSYSDDTTYSYTLPSLVFDNYLSSPTDLDTYGLSFDYSLDLNDYVVLDYALINTTTSASIVDDSYTTGLVLADIYNVDNNCQLDFRINNDVDGIYPDFVFNIGQQILGILSDNSGYYQAGYDLGYSQGYNEGLSEAQTYYQDGYYDGYDEGSSQDETAVAIFSGIISIALIPINFFLACLNFEVFGINIAGFVSALLTVAIVVIITRIIVSGGNGGDE